jgi:hypothetical protein
MGCGALSVKLNIQHPLKFWEWYGDKQGTWGNTNDGKAFCSHSIFRLTLWGLRDNIVTIPELRAINPRSQDKKSL